MENKREELWRALPFVMAMLLTALIPLSANALFGEKRAEAAPAPDAPIAQNMEIKTYRGVSYTGTLKAANQAGGALRFAVTQAPKKGTLELGEEGLFIYTPDKNKAGTDSFTFTAENEAGAVSAPAGVKIRIARVSSGVEYADTEQSGCATAAVDLAEHGVFVGAQIGGERFFEPERGVTRGEFVTMALAAAGIRPSDVTVTGFCDDDEIPAWQKGSAAGALLAGVVKGSPTSEGVAFRADSAMTLSEAATVLDRILRVTDVDLAALDGEQPAWYAQAVANLESVSIVPAGGFADESLSRGITRAEAAELLSAAMALSEAREASEGLFSRIF